MIEKCCGTCKWYSEIPSGRKGYCGYSLPQWIVREVLSVPGNTSLMEGDDGERCPCYQPRETPTERNES